MAVRVIIIYCEKFRNLIYYGKHIIFLRILFFCETLVKGIIKRLALAYFITELWKLRRQGNLTFENVAVEPVKIVIWNIQDEENFHSDECPVVQMWKFIAAQIQFLHWIAKRGKNCSLNRSCNIMCEINATSYLFSISINDYIRTDTYEYSNLHTYVRYIWNTFVENSLFKFFIFANRAKLRAIF